jgi:hypothetical protein
MSSESVWFEEIDTALIDYINSVVSVPVQVRKPELDFKDEEYPIITIYNLYPRYDIMRKSEDKVVSKDETNKVHTIEAGAEPFNLAYQIDFWSMLHSDMNDMLQKWLYKHSRDFMLPVKDKSGNQRYSYATRNGDGITRSDEFTGNKRLYHSTYTYNIRVELDEKSQVTKPMVTEIDIIDKEV